MRIVYVLTTLAVGGTERQVLGLARRMAARGHTVALMVLKGRQPDELETNLATAYLSIEKRLPSLFSGFRRGLAFLRSFQPDVVHSHNFHGNLSARMMRVFYRQARVISTIHNVYEGGRLRMLAYRLSDGLADRTTAVSEAVAARFVGLRAVGNERCLVLTNGIETSEFVPDPQRRAAMRAQLRARDEFIWLCVARNTAAKDIPNLLEAFGKVWQSEPKVALWMAAPDSEAGARRALHAISTMPIGSLDGLRRLQYRRDIPALLDAADGFVLSSAWEGMPLVLGEAMAMEKPVVATDVGGVRELVGDAGRIVPAKDAAALASAMLGVMGTSDEQRAALGHAARARILAGFDMDQKADEWEALYRSVCGHSASQEVVLP